MFVECEYANNGTSNFAFKFNITFSDNYNKSKFMYFLVKLKNNKPRKFIPNMILNFNVELNYVNEVKKFCVFTFVKINFMIKF